MAYLNFSAAGELGPTELSSTKAAVYFQSTIAATTNQAVTVGPPGAYRLIFRAGSAAGTQFYNLRVGASAASGQTFSFLLDQGDILYFDFLTKESSAQINVYNNSAVTADAAIMALQ